MTDGKIGTRQSTSAGAGWADEVGRGLAETDLELPPAPTFIDTSVAHPARRYDYWLGGKSHYAVDRASGDAVAAVFPSIRTAVLENRRFLRRAVSNLTREYGIRQFLDVGTGIPSPGNTHEVAQSIAPDARVVYVDNDPVVLVHARALLTSSEQGRTGFIHADLRRPDEILGHQTLAQTLNLSEPVGLILVAVLHFLPDEDRPGALVSRLIEALPVGSMVAISHSTFDFMPPEALAAMGSAFTPTSGPFHPRSQAEFTQFFDGLEVVAPGIVPVNQWRADAESGPRPTVQETAVYGGVARVI